MQTDAIRCEQGPRRSHAQALPLAALAALGSALPSAAHAQLGSAIPNPSGKKASELVCDALQTVNQIAGSSGIFGALPVCRVTSTNDLYYHGSRRMEDSIADLFISPYVTNGAYFCAIADSNGASATASANALGKFGIDSTVRLFRDPVSMTVEGERRGTIWLFGAGLTIEAQDFKFSFPNEITAPPKQWGGYMRVEQSGLGAWDWNPPRVSFPIATPAGVASIGFDIDMFLRHPHERLTNNLLHTAPMPDFSFAAWQRCPNLCSSMPPGSLCGCPLSSREAVSKFFDDHQGTCAGACTSLSDGKLPYLGPYGGASGVNADYLYPNPLVNWLGMGRVNPRKLVRWPREDLPNHAYGVQTPFDITSEMLTAVGSRTTLRNTANAGGTLSVDASYDVGFMKTDLTVTTTFGFRDGFSVQQQDDVIVHDLGDPVTHQASVWTDIDAEAGISVGLALTVDVRLPIFDPPPVTVRADPLLSGQWSGRSAQLPAEIIQSIPEDRSGYSRFTSYKVKNVAKSDAEGGRLQCLQAPKTNRTPGPLTNAGDFVKNIPQGIISNIHPCDFTFCANGRTYTYRWNATRKALDTTDPGVPGCRVCTDTMYFCDGNNQVLLAQAPPGMLPRQVSVTLDSNGDENWDRASCEIR